MNLPDFSKQVPKAVALDLDGTSLNSQSCMSERTTRAVLDLIARGIPVVIATARPERVVPVLVGPQIAAWASLVHMSGAAATGRNQLCGEAWNPIEREQAKIAWDIVESSSAQPRMTMEVDGRRFAVNHESDANELWAFNSATPDMIISVEDALEVGPAKVSVNGLGEDLTEIVEALNAAINDQTVVVPAVDNSFINIHSVNATKSGAMLGLLKSNGISLDEVISFGDDVPDIDLMLNTGWPVAVENAIPRVKSAAKFLTASNDEEGVAMVLERMLEALERNHG